MQGDYVRHSQTNREMSPDLFPSHDSYQQSLDCFLREGINSHRWHRPAADCPTLKAILVRRREFQARFLLAVLTRSLWQLECRGQPAVARFFLLLEAAKLLLSRKLPWNKDTLTVLVLLTAHPNLAPELGALVLRQVRWKGRPSEPVRRALKRLKKAGEFQSEIEPLLSHDVFLPEASSLLKERQLRNLFAHARRLPDTVSRRWYRKGEALLKQLGGKETEESLIPWIRQELPNLHRDHSRLLRGLVVVLGSLPSQLSVECLAFIAGWSYQRRQGHGARDTTLARSAIRSLARLGSRLAVAYLVILGSELRYPSATEELLKALRKLAKKRDGSLHDLVEVDTAHWSPDSPLGRRLWRSHLRRLERCLRTGKEWSYPDWKESYQESPLLGAMGRKLIWEDRTGRAFWWADEAWREPDGRPVQPAGHVRLWHPADAHQVALGSNSPTTLFPQWDRDLFFQLDFKPCLVKQYQCAALFRQRDWHYAPVGRFRATSRAVLGLAGCRITLHLERAADQGPFSREGLSIQARFTGLESEPPLDQIPPRVLSEVARDLRLFRAVSAIVQN